MPSKGIIKYKNGDEFIGHLRNEAPFKGTKRFANGDEYEGLFSLDGKFDSRSFD